MERKVFELINCKFVIGSKNAAIYNINSGKVYSINSAGKQILEYVLKNNDISSLNSEALEYLNELERMGLGCIKNSYKTKKYYINKQNTDCKIKASLRFMWLEIEPNCNLHCLH